MKFFIKIFITVLIFVSLFLYIDTKNVLDKLLETNIFFVILAIISQFFSTLIASYRWFLIMKILECKDNFKFFFESYFKGSFFNQLLPSNIGGDAIRVLDLKSQNYGLKESIFGVFIDRVLGLASLVLLSFISNLLNSHLLPKNVFDIINLISLITFMGVIFFIFLHKIKLLKDFKIIKNLYELSLDFYKIFSFLFLNQLFLSILVHLFSIFSFFLIAKAISLDIPFFTFLVIIPMVILFMALPISLAGWGVREGAMVGLFGLIGISKEPIFLVSLLYGFVVIITIVPGFLVWSKQKEKIL